MKKLFEKIKNWVRKNKKVSLYLLIFVLVFSFDIAADNKLEDYKAGGPKWVEYTQFVQMTDKGNVKEIFITPGSAQFTFSDKEAKVYRTDNPRYENFKKDILEKNIKVVEVQNVANDVLIPIIRFGFMVFIMIFALNFFTKGIGGNQKNMEIPEEKIPSVKFANIAGNAEVKEDMQYLVEFLKNPTRYTDMGAKLPKGVVLYGPPGTGKTLMAKAIAGEAGVPFFSISGSDFVEMYVGLGAKRVRKLFESARKKAPCIIFIDEIDAVGTKRGTGQNSEKDQTINALLNELDGFSGSEGVIVIAATNLIANLDEALIRPGRFDKHIAINLPDAKDRLDIINIHARNKRISKSVDFEELSKTTIGFSGAGIESLLNEATILAVNRNKKTIEREDIDDAYYKVIMKGDKKKNRQDRDKKEMEIVAWHEAGHALCSKLMRDVDVPTVSIVPSTSGAGGVTLFTPKKMGLESKEELISDIMVCYAGRAAEQLLAEKKYGTDKSTQAITNGASMDIMQATKIIKNMIGAYGMNGSLLNYSQFENTGEQLLKEAEVMAENYYSEALSKLRDNVDILEDIASELMIKETLIEVELDEIISKRERKVING